MEIKLEIELYTRTTQIEILGSVHEKKKKVILRKQPLKMCIVN